MFSLCYFVLMCKVSPLFTARCYKCNKLGHFARECKMEGERCYNCNKIGHIAKDCDKEIDEGTN